MTEALAPTQLAYDRIQRAATRSPMNYPDNISIHYELTTVGLRIRGVGPGSIEREAVVTWSAMARGTVDPLPLEHDRVLQSIRNELAGARVARKDAVLESLAQ